MRKSVNSSKRLYRLHRLQKKFTFFIKTKIEIDQDYVNRPLIYIDED